MRQAHQPTTSHNYMVPMIELANKLHRAGKVMPITVEHDRWCDIHTGGFCNCSPVVRPGAP